MPLTEPGAGGWAESKNKGGGRGVASKDGIALPGVVQRLGLCTKKGKQLPRAPVTYTDITVHNIVSLPL